MRSRQLGSGKAFLWSFLDYSCGFRLGDWAKIKGAYGSLLPYALLVKRIVGVIASTFGCKTGEAAAEQRAVA
jgi:hypothetical protein